MKNVRKLFTAVLLLFASIFFNLSNSYAQACGQAIFTIELFSLSGTEVGNVSYEIYPINNDSLQSVYSPNGNGEHLLNVFKYNWSSGTIIESKHAVRILDTVTDFNKSELRRSLRFTKNKSRGRFKDGSVQFSTFETYTAPYLLKIYSEDKEVWVLVHVFDGCNRTTAVLWDDRPQIVKRQ